MIRCHFIFKINTFTSKTIENIFTIFTKQTLKEYLFNANIYKGKINMSKHDLIDMIISEKSKKKKKKNVCTRK